VEDHYVPPSPDRAVYPRCLTPVDAGRGVPLGQETTRLRLHCPACGQEWTEVRDAGTAATRFWSVPLPPPRGLLARLRQAIRRRGPR
jgi:hypothetical protein